MPLEKCIEDERKLSAEVMVDPNAQWIDKTSRQIMCSDKPKLHNYFADKNPENTKINQ